MNGRCDNDPLDRALDVCQLCSGEFCLECVIFPHGDKKPAVCKACAVIQSGLRQGTRPGKRMSTRDVKKRRAELAEMTFKKVDTFQFFDESGEYDLAEVDPSDDAEDASTPEDQATERRRRFLRRRKDDEPIIHDRDGVEGDEPEEELTLEESLASFGLNNIGPQATEIASPTAGNDTTGTPDPDNASLSAALEEHGLGNSDDDPEDSARIPAAPVRPAAKSINNTSGLLSRLEEATRCSLQPLTTDEDGSETGVGTEQDPWVPAVRPSNPAPAPTQRRADPPALDTSPFATDTAPSPTSDPFANAEQATPPPSPAPSPPTSTSPLTLGPDQLVDPFAETPAGKPDELIEPPEPAQAIEEPREEAAPKPMHRPEHQLNPLVPFESEPPIQFTEPLDFSETLGESRLLEPDEQAGPKRRAEDQEPTDRRDDIDAKGNWVPPVLRGIAPNAGEEGPGLPRRRS